MKAAFRKLWRFGAAWRRDTSGAAAVELAIMASLLTIPLLNVVDLAFYAFRFMQVQNAAQVGAQAAWATCDTTAKLPATNTTKCPGFASAVTAAIQSTSLSTGVTQATGSPAEGYYCTTTAGALQLVGTAGTVGAPPSGQPATCAGVSGASAPTAAPGDYVQVNVSYTFTPVFSGVSLASLLPSPITTITWTRLN